MRTRISTRSEVLIHDLPCCVPLLLWFVDRACVQLFFATWTEERPLTRFKVFGTGCKTDLALFAKLFAVLLVPLLCRCTSTTRCPSLLTETVVRSLPQASSVFLQESGQLYVAHNSPHKFHRIACEIVELVNFQGSRRKTIRSPFQI